MAQSPPSVHYEVYTQTTGQRWNLHARYEKNERESALADAKQVEKNLKIPAKVVREVYYPANNTSEESLVYAGDAALRAKMKERASAAFRPRGVGGGGGGGGGYGGGVSANKPSAAARTTAGAQSAVKLLIVLAASLTIAGTITGTLDALVNPREFGLGDSLWSAMLFGTFVVCFIGAAMPLAKFILNRTFFEGGQAPVKPPVMPPIPTAKEKPPEPAQTEIDISDLIDDDELLEPEAPPEAVAEEEPLYEEEVEIPGEEAEIAEADVEGAAEAPVESGATVFLKFVKSLVNAVRAKKPTLDAYNLFGVDLIMAGAVDVLGQHRNMAVEERRSLLKGAIEAMGVKPATAQAFADKYEEYLGESKYMPMILAGRSGMEEQLAGHDTMAETIGPALDLWNKPKSPGQTSSSRIMTVMFTDMVGSTDMTQALGDHAAQKIVRRHNTIVRHALAEFEGKEIKHTGDGIMCSFSSAANGVEASIAIQRAIAQHNAQHPDLPLHVRIGINSGEPVEEENDIFGGTVQLSARVCARCDTDEILCSNVVKELCAGRSFDWTSLGPQPLKGFKEAIVLYQVEWREAKKASVAASATPA